MGRGRDARHIGTTGPAVATAVACLFGAQAIHTAVIAGHYREWWAEGVFFFGLGLLEGGLAAMLLLAPGRRAAGATVALSVATVALWAWSRTVGVPLGPAAGYVEPVGRADVVASLLEVATAIVLAPAALGASQPAGAADARGHGARRAAAAAAAVALLTVVGVTGAAGHAHRTAPPAGLSSNPR
jgi:hypothetical protein